MTREEAINIVKGAKQYLTAGNPIWDVKKIGEALSMAIEALHREEAEEKGWCHRINYIPKPCEDANCDCIEVVRCKDCQHSRVYGKTTQWLACENVMEGQATDPDGYCYLGERREP